MFSGEKHIGVNRNFLMTFCRNEIGISSIIFFLYTLHFLGIGKIQSFVWKVLFDVE